MLPEKKSKKYIQAIGKILSSKRKKAVFMDEGFENDDQRIHFNYRGKKCMLDAVIKPNEKGNLPIIVTRLDDYEQYFITLTPKGLNKPKLLERICCEVYEWLWNPEEDEDWVIYNKKLFEKK